MHTIKVDVENCCECVGFKMYDYRVGCSYWCGIDKLAGSYVPGHNLEYNLKEAPDWCPAREGVKVEAK